MITKIDSHQRVFLVQQYGWANDYVFCNLKDLQKCMKEMDTEPYHVRHFWNRKFERISKKSIIEMLEAAKIKITLKILLK